MSKLTIIGLTLVVSAAFAVFMLWAGFEVAMHQHGKREAWEPEWPEVSVIGHYYGNEYTESEPAFFDEYENAYVRVWHCGFDEQIAALADYAYRCAMQVVLHSDEGQLVLTSNGPATSWTADGYRVGVDQFLYPVDGDLDELLTEPATGEK